MRNLIGVLAALVLSVAMAPLALADDIAGDDVQEQLRIMQERLSGMQEQLDSANQRITDLSAREVPSAGPVSNFLRTVELGGWASASYWYNFNDPDGEILGFANTAGVTNPFNPSANSFQFDQLWFEIERPVNESQRAGFRADIVFGKTADLLSDGVEDGLSGSDEDLEIYQAYVQYLAPVGNGVHIKFGKFATFLGAEVVQAPYNFNISRGNVYNLLQPITHVGISAAYDFENGWDAALALVNENVSAVDIELNNRKSIMWHLGFAPSETVGVSFNGIWGSSDSYLAPMVASPLGLIPAANEKADELILDLVLSWDPTDQLSTWLNFDYRTVDAPGRSMGEAWGVAVAGRYAWSDRLGTALRLEWVDDDGGVFGFGQPGGDLTIYSLTGTVDYALTTDLKIRGEVRYDRAEGNSANNRPAIAGLGLSGDEIFTGDSFFNGVNPLGSLEQDQLLVGVEAIYTF